MRNHRSAGFSYIELLVALAIMVVIATVVTPVLLGVLDKARFDATLETFLGIGEGVFNFEDDIGEYPGQLSQLTTQITGSDENICGEDYSTGPGAGNNEVNRWDGPYLNRLVPTTGLPTPIGRVRNQLEGYRQFWWSNPSELRMFVDSVVVEDAWAMNERIDGDGHGGSTTNAVRWTTADANGLVVLTFVVPIGSC